MENVDVKVDVNECGEIEKDEEADTKRESVVETETNSAPTFVVYVVEAEFDTEFESDVEKPVSIKPGKLANPGTRSWFEDRNPGMWKV